MTHEPSVRVREGFLAFLGYAVASLALFGRSSITRLGSTFVGPVDARLYVWSLAWWPHALAIGTDPFVSRIAYAPVGIDLSWVTALPGPALVMAPITGLFGPIVSLNVLMLLSPALAAWAAYLVCRRATGARWASVVGGWLFGFSAYMVEQMHGHVDLTLIFPVPLAVYLVLRRLDGSMSRRAFVWLLAAVLIAEFSISNEVFATMTVFGGAGLALALWCAPRERRADIRSLLGPAAVSYAIATVVLAPFLYYLVQGAGTVTIAKSLPGASTDLLSYVLPTKGFWAGGSALQRGVMSFVARTTENSAYIGVPLVVAIGVAGFSGRHNRVDRFLLAFIGITIVCALGPELHVAGAAVMPLPWALVERVPGLRFALPERFGAYTSLAIAVLIARWIARSAPSRARIRRWALVGGGLLLLLPSVAQAGTLPSVPDFFTDGAAHMGLTPSGAVLVIAGDNQQDMWWQARSAFSFSMVDGHTGPSPIALTRAPVWSAISHNDPRAIGARGFSRFLRGHDVRAIVVAIPQLRIWRPLLTTLGLRGSATGGVWIVHPSVSIPFHGGTLTVRAPGVPPRMTRR